MRSPAEWPIRWRLTLVFSAAMALVLAAAGAVTVVQFRDAAHEADPDGALRGLTDDITADLVRELVTILPIVLVIAAVAAYLLSRAALRPVDRIRAAAQTLTTTPHPDTDAPLPVPPTDDEIAWLATTLNTMLTRLQRALLGQRPRQQRRHLGLVLDHQDAHTRHPAACPARAATSSHRRFICHPYRRSRTPSQRGRPIRRKR